MKIIKIFSLLIFIFFSLTSISKAQGLLFLNQAVSAAIKQNPDVAVQQGRLNISRVDILTAASRLNPFFVYDGTTNDNFHSWGLQKTFEPWGIHKQRVKIAKTQADLDSIRVNFKVVELKKEVRNAFTKYYVNQEKLKILDELKQFLLKEIEKNIENLSEVDQLIVEERIMQLSQIYDDAEYEMERIEFTLENLLGEEIEEDLKLNSPLEVSKESEEYLDTKGIIIDDLSQNDLINLAYSSRPEILINHKEQEQSKNLKKLAEISRFPLMILGAGGKMNFDNRRAGAFWNADIELPILDFNRDEIKKAEVSLKTYQDELNIIQKDIKIEVVNAYEEYIHSKKRLIRFKAEHLPRLETLIEKIRNKYFAGEINIIQLLKAEDMRLEILKNYLESIADYESSISDLELSTATSLEGSDI